MVPTIVFLHNILQIQYTKKKLVYGDYIRKHIILSFVQQNVKNKMIIYDMF